MQKQSIKAEREISFETARSGNSADYLPRLLDFHEQLTNEWVKKLYAAHCEAWNQQNRSVSAEFIRAIRDRPIAELIAARKSSVEAAACIRGTQVGELPNSVALDEWNRRMDRLATLWNGKLEAEAVASEYRSARNRKVGNSYEADSRQSSPALESGIAGEREAAPMSMAPPSSSPSLTSALF